MNESLNFLKSADLSRWGALISLFLLFGFNLIVIWHRFLADKFKLNLKINLPHIRWRPKINLGFLMTLGGIVAVNSTLVFAGSAFAAGMVVPEPQVIIPNSPSLSAVEITAQNPFRIVFDRPIDTGALEKSLSPDLDGNWQFASTNYPLLSDTLIFVPHASPPADGRYTVALKNIKNVAGTKTSEYLLSFMTPPLPSVKSINPANGTEGILPGQEITVETDFPHEDTARLEFKFQPETPIDIKKEGGTVYKLTAKDGFKKSTVYNLEVNRIPVSRNFETGELNDIGEAVLISQSNFRTLEAPGVADYGPKGSGILVDSSVWIEFKQDMDRAATEAAFAFSPSVSGSKAWESNRKLVFKPAGLAKNTTYNVSVSKDAKAIDGSPFEDVFGFSFTTIGYVAVSSFSPGNNAGGVALAAKVSVTFNQAVDHASAESKFAISPNPGGSFSWSGNTLYFNHSNFSYYTRYTVSMAAGIKTVYGLDSAQTFSAAFTTQQQSVMLSVPSYHQAHMYSCMASAARSALAYRGVYVAENTILSLIGYDYTPFSGTWGDPNAVWGNPYSGVVGNIDGKSGGVTWGYGAYWTPTSKAIGNYRANEVKTGWNVSGVAQEIASGNPVIVWWVNGVWPAYEVNWKTTGGTPIRGVNSMHVQVVKGFTGTIENPTSFTVTDSGYGYPAHTYDVNTFKAKWGWFGNSAIIVR